MSPPPGGPDVRVLALLLRRLYARLRARGVQRDAALGEAARMAADLLACDVSFAREVLEQIPLSGVRRPV